MWREETTKGGPCNFFSWKLAPNPLFEKKPTEQLSARTAKAWKNHLHWEDSPIRSWLLLFSKNSWSTHWTSFREWEFLLWRIWAYESLYFTQWRIWRRQSHWRLQHLNRRTLWGTPTRKRRIELKNSMI